MKKRLLSALLALCMVVGMLPASARAEEAPAAEYELRTLTFEDADYKGGENMVGKKDWSSLIDSSQYGGTLLYPTNGVVYNWYDEGNTYLKHQFTDEWGDHKYWGGGEAISNYNSGDYVTYGGYDTQLTVHKKGVSGLATTGGGHNGSNNFAVHYGYVDSSPYGGTKLQALTFGDGVARVIDHMYVNNICYALNCYYNGNGYTASIGESDWVKLVATGYHADGTTATAEIYLCNGPDNIVTDWTKWDLSSLGEITKLELNVMGSSDNGYGFSQPAYFAYDDVAVRFPVTTEEPAPASKVVFNIDLTECGGAVSGTYLAMDAENEENYEESAITSGSKSTFSSDTGAYGFYCVELETSKSSNIIGWNVNGKEYLLSTESTDYSLGNDVCVSVGLGKDDSTLLFDLILGVENMAYATEGTWDISPVIHTCAFDQKVVSEDYLATEADCTNAATYYYSCTCGKKGTETFADGEALGHKDENSDRICDVCEENLNRVPVLVEGVTDVTVKIQTSQGYQLKDLEGGKIFTDPDGDKLDYSSYFYRKSSDGGETWGELTGFTASLFGGNDMTFVNDKEGTYTYKFWAYDGYGYSEETWTLTLIVMDVVPADINFYVGYDQNYKTNGNVYPVLELYRTAGIDDDFNDYIGWFVNGDGETVRIYNPHEYVITDGETDYVTIDGAQYELHDYEKMTFTNSAFNDAAEEATASGTVVGNYNVFYATLYTGRYSTRFYGYNTETSAYDIYLGGQSMALPMETDIYGGGGNNLYFRIVSVYTTSKTTAGVYFGADDYDAQITMPITGSNIQHGDPYVENSKTYYPFMSWANGNGSLYNIYVYPYDTGNYIFNQAINQTTSAGASVVTKNMTISTAVELKVTVPEDGEFDLYFQYNNFNTKAVEPKGEAVNNGDGTKTLSYAVSKGNSNYTWRLTDPTGAHVTSGGWVKGLSAATEVTYTYSEATNKASHDFSQLGTTVATRDEADVQLFSSHSGFLSTASTTRIRAYRMWELINSDTANIMVEPDFNIQVLQGNAGDIVAVNGGNGSSNWLDVTPSTTDIVAVNYDSMDVYADNGTHSTHGGLFPATNPERTAVMVVTNEAAGSADATIRFNGSLETNRGTEWDYNYDTWFYMDTDEAPELDFTVSATGDVTVSWASVITDYSLNSTLSGWTTLTPDEDGAYHADLLCFRNAGTLGGTVIIKMTDSTGTSYRLARVAQMSVTVSNASFPGEPLTPGSSVKLTFDGLYRSVNKISGIFNPTTYYLRYTADGDEVNGQLGQYQQMDRASITLTIPENVEMDEDGKATYTFTNGYIYGSMYSASSPFSTMYQMTDTGVGTNFSAVGVNFVLSRLADITVEVETMSTFDVTVDVTDGESAISGYTFTLTDPNGEVVTPDESGIYRQLEWGEYSYSLKASGYIYDVGTLTVGSEYADKKDEDGIVHWTFQLVKGTEGCWDGTTSEPAQVDGVYQIGTGAELAWFAEYVNAGNTTASAVLTADIDLAEYEWTPIGNASVKFAGSFDGQNHTVSNLAIRYTSTAASSPYVGLFGYVEGTSSAHATVCNLTVAGEITMTSTGTVANAYSGAVMGYAKYADLTNLHNAANVTVNRVKGNWTQIGGIVGTAWNCTISDCSNSGAIKGYQYVGGIAGQVNATNVIRCHNTGAIEAYQYAGGVIAYLASGSLSRSYNTGAISSGHSYIGGVAAKIYTGSVVSDCYNAGSVNGGSGYAGGVVGYVVGTVTGCYNVGSVTATGTFTGGVAGYAWSNNNSTSISNCFTTGTVTDASANVGAALGYAQKSTVANVYYLEGIHEKGMGGSKDSTGEPVAVSAETIASAKFVTSMNADLDTPVFVSGENHPILYWERDLVVTLTKGKGYTLKGNTSVAGGESYTFTVETLSTYEKTENFAVKVNGETVTANEDGIYTVENVSADLTITVEGLEAITIDITVYYADNGTIVVGDDANKTLLNYAPVTVSDVNDDGKFTMYDGFYCLHEQYHKNGAAGYTDSNWVTQFWSVSTAMVSYGRNNRWVFSTADEIAEGDSLCLFTYQDQMSWSDLYTYFDSIATTATAQQEVSYHVNGYSFFGSGSNMDAIANPVGATVTATCGDKTLTTTTDAEGNFKLTFPCAGEWTVLVNGKCSYTCDVGYYAGVTYTDAPVTPALMTVTVSEPPYVAPDPIEVYMYYATRNDGIVAGKDGTLLNYVPITVTDADKDGVFTMSDAFYALHEAYYEGGAEAGYTLGTFTVTFWGKNLSYGQYERNGSKDGVYPETAIEAGDMLAILAGYGYNSLWTHFENGMAGLTATATAGEATKFHVTAYQANGAVGNVTLPEGATVTATCGDTTITTTVDANGDFTLTFPTAGEYSVLVDGTSEVNGVKCSVIPALMTVTVEAPNYTITLPEDTAFTVTPCTGYTTSVKEGESFKFFVEASVGYQPGDNFIVKADGETLTADSMGNYTLENVTSNVTITVEGMEAILWEPVDVYLSISHDGQFQTGKETGEVMALRKISVPYFDLALYGLEDFYFSSESYGTDGGEHSSALLPGTAQYAYGKTTLLHLYIYALEVYYCGLDESEAGKGYLYNEGLIGTDVLTITGSVGSLYMNQFWGGDENLNYYVNYQYPLASEGWGSTSDQILLRENDVISLGHFTSWTFYSDPEMGFNYLTPDEANKVYGSTTVTQGDKLTLTAYRAGADESGNYTTGHVVNTNQPTIYYAEYDNVTADVTKWTKLGTANADGTIVFDTTSLKPGTYVVAMAGQYGKDNPDDICSAPGGIIVVVEEKKITIGDLDGDGEIKAQDVAVLYGYLNGKTELSDEMLAAADVNGDGNVDVRDVAMLYAYLNGKIETLG